MSRSRICLSTPSAIVVASGAMPIASGRGVLGVVDDAVLPADGTDGAHQAPVETEQDHLAVRRRGNDAATSGQKGQVDPEGLGSRRKHQGAGDLSGRRVDQPRRLFAALTQQHRTVRGIRDGAGRGGLGVHPGPPTEVFPAAAAALDRVPAAWPDDLPLRVETRHQAPAASGHPAGPAPRGADPPDRRSPCD